MNNRENLVQILANCKDISRGDEFYIWGAGNTTDLNWDDVEKEKLVPTFLIDNNKKGKFHNVNIIAPNDVVNSGIILISSAVPQRNQEIIDHIKSIDKSLEYHTIDEVIFGRHSEEILKTYDLLANESSKKTYFEIITARIKGTVFPNIEVSNDTYFHYPQFKMRNSNEVFVDCGAFVGDTVEQYLFCREGTFKRIVAVEPDKRNIELLHRRVERLRGEWCTGDKSIEVVYGAIGEHDGEVCINDSIESLGTKVSENDSENKVKLYSIDTLLKNSNVGFIKADIEGYEMKMLKGAKECITKNHPLLAICVYHKTSDLYEIPLFICKMNDKYKIDIAHHYYTYTDTVLYAYE